MILYFYKGINGLLDCWVNIHQSNNPAIHFNGNSLIIKSVSRVLRVSYLTAKNSKFYKKESKDIIGKVLWKIFYRVNEIMNFN